jgi:hypothetical protein
MPSKKPRDPTESSNESSTESSNESSTDAPGQAAEIRLDSAGQVAVTYSTKPPKGPPDKQIHPRRRLAEVPDAPPRKRDQK